MTESNSIESLLTLMQLSDSAIPIGGYSHSWGLETWIQNNVIADAKSAQEAIQQLLSRSIAPQEGIACGIAHSCCVSGQVDRLLELNDVLTASKWSKEIFQASSRMGHRLLKLALETNLVPSLRALNPSLQQLSPSLQGLNPSLQELSPSLQGLDQSLQGLDQSLRKQGPPLRGHDPLIHGRDQSISELDPANEYHHSIVFGWLAACANVSELSAISAYLQNSSNGLISACVRLIPLGHTDGQRITVAMRPLISELAEQSSQRQIEDISSFAPLHEAACFAHEDLYSRLFQS